MVSDYVGHHVLKSGTNCSYKIFMAKFGTGKI